MIELSIGTRFYYNGGPCEVVEVKNGFNRCIECELFPCKRGIMACSAEERKDGKEVCFNWIF